ncbi:MAG: hypothetical protein WD267_01360 [Balneolales bacterium]
MKRRLFLRTTTIAVAGLPLSTIVGCNKNNQDHIHCQTGEDILGPFYRAEAPYRNALNVLSEEGTPIIIHGTVRGGADCDTLLAQETLDVWQADDSGAYDNESSDFKFRGRVKTNDQSFYEFMSILPGRYLNGNEFRPRHIHFLARASNHLDLVTQLYFEGDPYIPSDPWASQADTGRIIKLNEVDEVLTGEFDINLQLR